MHPSPTDLGHFAQIVAQGISTAFQVIQTVVTPQEFRKRWNLFAAVAVLVVGVLVVGVLVGRATSPSISVGPTAALSPTTGTVPTSTVSPAPTPIKTVPPTPPHVGLVAPVYLDMLPETTGDQVTLGQVSIDGRSYQHGLQFGISFAESTLEASFSIPHGARTFSAVVGNDDNQSNDMWAGIPLLFEVFVDGRRVASLHARGRAHDPPLQVQVTGGPPSR